MHLRVKKLSREIFTYALLEFYTLTRYAGLALTPSIDNLTPI